MAIDLNKQRGTQKKILSNISWLLSDKVLDIALKVTVGVMVARYLGAEWFGHLNYALTVVAIAAPVVKLGLSNIVVKHISLHPDRAGTVLGSAFVIQLVTALVISSGLVVYLNLFNTNVNVTDPLVSILAITLVFQCSDVIVAWNQSKLISKYTVWANRISIIIGFIIKITLIQMSIAFSVFVWAWVTESVLRACLLFFFYQKYESIRSWSFDRTLAVELLRKSWPLMFSAIASIVYLKIDVVMLGNMKTGREVGVYSAAVRISELLYFIPTIVTATLLPSIVRSSKLEKTVFYTRMQALFDSLALYSYATILLLFICADWVIGFLFGLEFTESALILKIHVFALIFVASGVARNKLLIAENHTLFIMLATAAGAVVNVLANLYLIPAFSGVGAAIATVISYGVSSFFACLAWKPTLTVFRMIAASYLVLIRPIPLIRYVNELIDGSSSRPLK